MIDVTLFVDLDDAKKLTAFNRRIEATVPPGYSVKTKCMGWGRCLEDGRVHLDILVQLKSPPDLLPRVVLQVNRPASPRAGKGRAP